MDDEVAPVLLVLAAPDELGVEVAVAPLVGARAPDPAPPSPMVLPAEWLRLAGHGGYPWTRSLRSAPPRTAEELAAGDARSSGDGGDTRLGFASGCRTSIAHPRSRRSPSQPGRAVRAWRRSPCALVPRSEGLDRVVGHRGRARRDVGQGPAVGSPEPKRPVGLALDLVALLVDRAVVAATEQGQVRRAWSGRPGPSGGCDAPGRTATSQPGKRQPRSRWWSARRSAGGIVRVRAPISSEAPRPRRARITTRLASHARRCDVSAEPSMWLLLTPRPAETLYASHVEGPEVGHAPAVPTKPDAEPEPGAF